MADVFDEEQKEGEKQSTTVMADGEGEESSPSSEHSNSIEDSALPKMSPIPSSVYDTVEASVKYKSYVVRQEKDIESWRKAQGARIPPNIVYDHAIMPTFSKEEIEKLERHRPSTFAEASGISGLTPQSLVYLYHHVMKLNKEERRRKREESNSVAV